ncbi:MAG: hypothetical protein U0457_13850 [Candidatus Sericytochromatia bacterium]
MIIKEIKSFEISNLLLSNAIYFPSLKILSIEKLEICYLYEESFLFEIINLKTVKKIFSEDLSKYFKFKEKPSIYNKINVFIKENKIYFVYFKEIISLDTTSNTIIKNIDFYNKNVCFIDNPFFNDFLLVYNYEKHSILTFNINKNDFIKETTLLQNNSYTRDEMNPNFFIKVNNNKRYLLIDNYTSMLIYDLDKGNILKEIKFFDSDIYSFFIEPKFTLDNNFLIIPINISSKSHIAYIFNLKTLEFEYTIGEKFLNSNYKYNSFNLSPMFEILDPDCETDYEVEFVEISNNNQYCFYHTKTRGTIIFEISTGSIIDLDINYRYIFFSNTNKFLKIYKKFIENDSNNKKLVLKNCILCELVK